MPKPAYIIFLSFLVAPVLKGQVSISADIDKRDIRIGEQVQLSLQVSFTSVAPLRWFNIPDMFNSLEVVQRGRIDTAIDGNSIKLSQQITITGFDSGLWVIPSFLITAQGKNFATDSFRIKVSPVVLEGTDYKDIKDIAAANEKPIAGWLWWGISGALLLLLLLAWLLLRNRKKHAVAEPLTYAGAFEQAIKALGQLRQSDLPSKGMVKEYYSQLAEIFRNYLRGETGIRSLEKTSVELLADVKKMDLGESQFRQIAQSLRVCDFVKFARYKPETHEHITNVDTVEETIKIIHQHNP